VESKNALAKNSQEAGFFKLRVSKLKKLGRFKDAQNICSVCDAKFTNWGQCYDHNFLRFSPIFCKKLAFFSKTNVMIKILSQKRQFFR
jgi:hypothetical protein